jgi:hypothetical protein
LNQKREPIESLVLCDRMSALGDQSGAAHEMIVQSLLNSGFQPGNLAQSAFFIQRNAHLLPILKDAVEPLHRAFASARLTLGTDNTGATESGYGAESLVVTIWTTAEPQDALRRLQEFYNDWWIDAYPKAGGHLHFDVGFA